MMKTYQDLLECGENEDLRAHFCLWAISDHKASEIYKTAWEAGEYFKNRNPHIMRVQKYIYNAMGKKVPDVFSPNNKIPSNLYHYFVTQEVQTLLGNGASFDTEETKEKLGKGFDQKLQELAKDAINAGVSFGFWNFDHVEVFSLLEFVPLYDEYTGKLMAGIRFWQIAPNKPLCIVLFEPDGITEYVVDEDSTIKMKEPKHGYKRMVVKSVADGEFSVDMGNYEGFPIVPLYNESKQSAIVGKINTLDAYDLTLSQMVNNVDDGNFIYWVLKNFGGMDAQEDEEFIEQLKITRVAHANGDSDSTVEAHQVEAPFEANGATLEILRKQLFDDFMALDAKTLSSSNATATQILAAYEPLNSKCDALEYRVLDFVEEIMRLAGVEGAPSFTRSKLVNVQDEIDSVITAASFLSQEYVTQKILTLLGDGDKLNDVLEQMAADDMGKFEGAQVNANE